MLLHPESAQSKGRTGIWEKKEGFLVNKKNYIKLSRAQREQFLGTLLCILAITR